MLKSLNPSLYTNKQRTIQTFRYDWKLVDQNCPEYGRCPVYGELTLYWINGYLIKPWYLSTYIPLANEPLANKNMFSHENITVPLLLFFFFRVYCNRIKLSETINNSSDFIHNIKHYKFSLPDTLVICFIKHKKLCIWQAELDLSGQK